MKIFSRLPAAATHKTAFKIVFIYAVFSIFWIGFSDRILFYFVKNSDLLTTLQTIKGWLFIIASSIIVYILLCREITKAREVERGLSESQEKYRIMAELTGQMVYDYDMISGKISWSGSIFDITGWSVDEFPDITFDTWKTMIHEDDRQTILRQFDEALKKAEAYKLEYRFRKKDGSYVYVEDTGNFLKNAEGKIYRMLGSMKDISGRKQMEKNLLHSQKMEAIGTLAGGIAHDFNNILGAIIGYGDLAREDTVPGTRINDNLSKLLIASNRAKELVKQILAFSRQDEPEQRLVQPSEVVLESLKILRPTLPTTIDIIQDISEDTGQIYVDPTQVNQILMNLCTNAFHAMEESGGKLEISLKETEIDESVVAFVHDVKGGLYICLSVSDNGPGIPYEIKDKIFTPYFTTKEMGKGTGMGLSIVHSIVKSYGGFISVNSSAEKGTTVHIYLPVEKDIAEMVEDGTAKAPTGDERILFVDDEKSLTEMITALLKRLGYHVSASSNSLEAFDTFRENPDLFDLVITDQTMPNMTGIELAEQIRQIRSDIPIILCSGYPSRFSEEKAREVGIKEFIQKPLSKNEMARAVRQALDSQ